MKSATQQLIDKVFQINPSAKELGEGFARQLLELALQSEKEQWANAMLVSALKTSRQAIVKVEQTTELNDRAFGLTELAMAKIDMALSEADALLQQLQATESGE
jgi:alkyl sulfatase BDS1-like metallo-beta-lactamase superfamily hydrolase